MRAAVLILLLAACEAPPPKYGYDRCIQAAEFQKCMASLPAGPVATQYNDWDEVVAQCRDTAGVLAWRDWSAITVECGK